MSIVVPSSSPRAKTSVERGNVEASDAPLRPRFLTILCGGGRIKPSGPSIHPSSLAGRMSGLYSAVAGDSPDDSSHESHHDDKRA